MLLTFRPSIIVQDSLNTLEDPHTELAKCLKCMVASKYISHSLITS